jgi:hypothetical protein
MALRALQLGLKFRTHPAKKRRAIASDFSPVVETTGWDAKGVETHYPANLLQQVSRGRQAFQRLEPI